MDKMSADKRYINQYLYNSKKSRKYKCLYYCFEIFVLTATFSATILLSISKMPVFIPAILTGLATLLKSVSYLMGFQKQWINCRTITESLKSEKLYFDTKIEKYKNLNELDATEIFIIRIENIIRDGNKVWLRFMQSDSKK